MPKKSQNVSIPLHLKRSATLYINERCNDLLEVTGVASLPGSDFNRKHTELSCRLAYVNFDGTEALKISESIGKSPNLTIDDLTAVCGDVLVGINKLIEFVRIHKS